MNKKHLNHAYIDADSGIMTAPAVTAFDGQCLRDPGQVAHSFDVQNSQPSSGCSAGRSSSEKKKCLSRPVHDQAVPTGIIKTSKAARSCCSLSL